MHFTVDEAKSSFLSRLSKFVPCNQRGFPSPRSPMKAPKEILENPIYLLQGSDRGLRVHHVMSSYTL